MAQLRIVGSNPKIEYSLHGALNLVDLAGSERLDRSGAEGAMALYSYGPPAQRVPWPYIVMALQRRGCRGPI